MVDLCARIAHLCRARVGTRQRRGCPILNSSASHILLLRNVRLQSMSTASDLSLRFVSGRRYRSLGGRCYLGQVCVGSFGAHH